MWLKSTPGEVSKHLICNIQNHLTVSPSSTMPSTISFPVQPCIHAGSMFKSYDEFAFPSLNPLFSAFS